jgi:hypothetical protein
VARAGGVIEPADGAAQLDPDAADGHLAADLEPIGERGAARLGEADGGLPGRRGGRWSTGDRRPAQVPGDLVATTGDRAARPGAGESAGADADDHRLVAGGGAGLRRRQRERPLHAKRRGGPVGVEERGRHGGRGLGGSTDHHAEPERERAGAGHGHAQVPRLDEARAAAVPARPRRRDLGGRRERIGQRHDAYVRRPRGGRA